MFTVADSELYTLSSGCAGHAIEVSDLAAHHRDLGKAGTQFRDEIVSGVDGRQILVEDPSGNPVQLFEPIVPEAHPNRPRSDRVAKGGPPAQQRSLLFRLLSRAGQNGTVDTKGAYCLGSKVDSGLANLPVDARLAVVIH